MRNLLTCCGLVALLACSNSPPGGGPAETRVEVAKQNDLGTALEVEVGAAGVRFVLHVTNSSAQPVRLEFPSAQRYDFVVQGPAGAVVWRWSDDQMFAQMLAEETIPAGGSRDYTAVWKPGQLHGAYTAIGTVSASNRRIEQRASFEVQTR